MISHSPLQRKKLQSQKTTNVRHSINILMLTENDFNKFLYFYVDVKENKLCYHIFST